MPSPEEWICAAIESASDMATYPIFAPEGASLPFCTYQRTATDRSEILDGIGGGPVGTFSVMLHAASYAESKAIADTVREAIDNFNGDEGGLTIAKVKLTDERDGDPVFFEGRETAVFIVDQTYSIEWEE